MSDDHQGEDKPKLSRAEHAAQHIVGPAPPPGARRRPNPPPTIDLQPGRPPIYQEGFPEVVRRLCLLGHTDAECASFFGVSVDTIGHWDVAHPEFFGARACARELADADVAVGLYHRAVGYEHPDTHVAVSQGVAVLTPITKIIPPDVDAARWWLKNRQSAKWRDRQEIEQSGTIGLGVIAVPPKRQIG